MLIHVLLGYVNTLICLQLYKIAVLYYTLMSSETENIPLLTTAQTERESHDEDSRLACQTLQFNFPVSFLTHNNQ